MLFQDVLRLLWVSSSSRFNVEYKLCTARTLLLRELAIIQNLLECREF